MHFGLGCLYPIQAKLESMTQFFEFEKCLIAKMRMHRAYYLEDLARYFQREATTIGTYIGKWAPKWGQVGKYLSILDLEVDYLEDTYPEDTYPESYKKVGLLRIEDRVPHHLFKLLFKVTLMHSHTHLSASRSCCASFFPLL